MTTSEQDHKTSENLDAARELAREGFKVFPARPDKRPFVRNWAETATHDPEQIERWWRKWPEAVPALPTGTVNGIAVADLDRKTGRDGIESCRALGIDPDNDGDLIVETPSGGRHIYFDHRAGLRNSQGRVAPGIDVRADGGYVVAPGAITAVGRYKVIRGTPANRILWGRVYPDQLVPDQREPEPSSQSVPGGHDPEELWGALGHVSSACGYEEWLEILMALHHATGGSAKGLALAQAWSARDYRGYDRREVEKKW